MNQLSYNSLNEALVSLLPELQEAYEKELTKWKGEIPPRHVLYATIFNPVLQKALTNPVTHEQFLTRAFFL